MSFIFILRSCSCFTSTSSGWRWAPEMLACRRPRFCWGAQGLTQSFFLLDEGGGGLITSWESPKFACLPYLGDWVVCLVSPLSSKLKIQEEMQARLWGDSALPSVVTVSSSLPMGTLRPQGGCAETCPVFSCFVGQCASDGTRSLATRAGIWERLYFVCVEVEGGEASSCPPSLLAQLVECVLLLTAFTFLKCSWCVAGSGSLCLGFPLAVCERASLTAACREESGKLQWAASGVHPEHVF